MLARSSFLTIFEGTIWLLLGCHFELLWYHYIMPTKSWGWSLLERIIWWLPNCVLELFWNDDLTVAKSFFHKVFVFMIWWNGWSSNRQIVSWDGIRTWPSIYVLTWQPPNCLTSHHPRIVHHPCSGRVMWTSHYGDFRLCIPMSCYWIDYRIWVDEKKTN